MFERFTDRSRRVIVLAQEVGRNLGHNYIGTEHLLCGLAMEEHGIASQQLRNVGIDKETVQNITETIVGKGSGQATGHIPFTDEAKRTLESSLREALRLQHNYIGTEHLLLGLLRIRGQYPNSNVFRILNAENIDLDMLKAQIEEQVKLADPRHTVFEAPVMSSTESAEDRKIAMRAMREYADLWNSDLSGYVILEGELDAPFRVTGPFPSEQAAQEWITTHPEYQTPFIAPVHKST